MSVDEVSVDEMSPEELSWYPKPVASQPYSIIEFKVLYHKTFLAVIYPWQNKPKSNSQHFVFSLMDSLHL